MKSDLYIMDFLGAYVIFDKQSEKQYAIERFKSD